VVKPNRIRELLETRPADRSTVSFYLAAETVQRVKCLAAKRGITASQVVEVLLEHGLEDYETMSGEKLEKSDVLSTNVPRARRRRRP
jgi:hypothetical protein